MILAALGFLLCVGLLTGSWAVNEPVTQAAKGTLAMVEQYLSLVGDITTRTSSTVVTLSQELAQANQTIDSMSEEDKERVSAEIQETLGKRVGP
jgi:CHASE3 domain sensor protein